MKSPSESPELNGKKVIIYGAIAILLFTLLMGVGTFACGKLWPKPAPRSSDGAVPNDPPRNP